MARSGRRSTRPDKPLHYRRARVIIPVDLQPRCDPIWNLILTLFTSRLPTSDPRLRSRSNNNGNSVTVTRRELSGNLFNRRAKITVIVQLPLSAYFTSKILLHWKNVEALVYCYSISEQKAVLGCSRLGLIEFIFPLPPTHSSFPYCKWLHAY